MNALDSGDPKRTFFRSMATRSAGAQLPERFGDILVAVQAAGFDLVIVETPGIGQGDAAIVPFGGISLYVMTPEFGAASQLEKIDMLDFADVVAINKFERRGAEDARRDVSRQLVRNREAFGARWEDMPVFGTSAARFNDDGVSALYQHLKALLAGKGLPAGSGVLPQVAVKASTALRSVVPSARSRYLADIADAVRGYHQTTQTQSEVARRRQHLTTAADLLGGDEGSEQVRKLLATADGELLPDARDLLDQWPARKQQYDGDEFVYTVRGREFRTPLTRITLSGSKVPRVALPRTQDDAELLRFLRSENLPGFFPFTAGVFPFKP